jgi:hypothetical protein
LRSRVGLNIINDCRVEQLVSGKWCHKFGIYPTQKCVSSILILSLALLFGVNKPSMMNIYDATTAMLRTRHRERFRWVLWFSMVPKRMEHANYRQLSADWAEIVRNASKATKLLSETRLRCGNESWDRVIVLSWVSDSSTIA